MARDSGTQRMTAFFLPLAEQKLKRMKVNRGEKHISKKTLLF